MKRILLLIIVFVLFVFMCMSHGAGVTTFPQLLKPDSITVANGQVIIAEGASIFIYSLKDFSLQTKFGKAGDGPKEFRLVSYGVSTLTIDAQPDALLISSVGKLSLYTRDGRLIKEMKISHNVFGNVFRRLGNGFAGVSAASDKDGYFLRLNIYDAALNKLKEICRWDLPYKPGTGTRIFTENYVFHTTGNKVVTSGGTEFRLLLFDSSGKKLQTIHQPYEKIKISSQQKKAVIQFLKTSPSTRDIFPFMQPIIFPDYFPAIQNFIVKNGKIYVLTYKRENNESEFFIFDLKGKLLKKVFLPLVEQTLVTYFPFDIAYGKLYQLVENEKEEWELHVTEI